VPAAIGLLLVAEPVLATIFHGGEFDDVDLSMSAASLVAYAPGLVGFVLIKVLAPAYFARQDTRTPVRVGVRTVLLNVVLNVMLVNLLLRTGWAPPHAGLALATSLAGLFNAGMLLKGLVASGVYRSRTRWAPLFVRVALACAAMTAFLLVVLRALGDWTLIGGLERVGWLAACVVGAMLVYAAACAASGVSLRARGAEPRGDVDADNGR